LYVPTQNPAHSIDYIHLDNELLRERPEPTLEPPRDESERDLVRPLPSSLSLLIGRDSLDRILPRFGFSLDPGALLDLKPQSWCSLFSDRLNLDLIDLIEEPNLLNRLLGFGGAELSTNDELNPLNVRQILLSASGPCSPIVLAVQAVISAPSTTADRVTATAGPASSPSAPAVAPTTSLIPNARFSAIWVPCSSAQFAALAMPSAVDSRREEVSLAPERIHEDASFDVAPIKDGESVESGIWGAVSGWSVCSHPADAVAVFTVGWYTSKAVWLSGEGDGNVGGEDAEFDEIAVGAGAAGICLGCVMFAEGCLRHCQPFHSRPMTPEPTLCHFLAMAEPRAARGQPPTHCD
jgi:hypothetical protein